MENILVQLGFKNSNDLTTIIPLNSFSSIDIDLIREVLIKNKMNDDNLADTEELKFEYINRILMFKYGKLIDSIKDIDEKGVGYRLELMP